MKNLLTLLILCLGLTAFSQIDNEPVKWQDFLLPEMDMNSKNDPSKISEPKVKDSTYQYYFQEDFDDYVLNARQRFKYNDDGFVILAEDQAWDFANDVFFVGERTHYTYADQHTLMLKRSEVFLPHLDQWMNTYQTVFSYSSNQNIELDQEWDDNIVSWVNKYRRTFLYNELEKFDEVTLEKWNDENPDDWNFVWKYSYSYDEIDRLENFVFQRWDGDIGDWKPTRKMEFLYDSNENNYLIKEYEWNSDTSEWEEHRRFAREFDEDGLVVAETSRVWVANDWLYEYQELTTYDIDHNVTQSLNLRYIPGTGWQNDWKEDFTYEDMHVTQKLGYSWAIPQGGTEREWIPGEREDHFWSELVTAIFTPLQNEFECSYPNPIFSGNTIRCELEMGKDYDLVLFDARGRLAFSSTFSGSEILDAENSLQQGMYFLMIRNGDRWVYRDKVVIH